MNLNVDKSSNSSGGNCVNGLQHIKQITFGHTKRH